MCGVAETALVGPLAAAPLDDALVERDGDAGALEVCARCEGAPELDAGRDDVAFGVEVLDALGDVLAGLLGVGRADGAPLGEDGADDADDDGRVVCLG